jgi:hypothetical protein
VVSTRSIKENQARALCIFDCIPILALTFTA